MISKDHQKGVGLIEVLVALVVLAIGVLGYVMLQMRALEATAESAQRIQAINIARDLAERIRVNRDGWTFTAMPKSYLTELSDAAKQIDRDKNCGTTACTSSELADYDVKEIVTFAQNLGMTMNLIQCPKQSSATPSNGRYCVYVAWGNTSATNDAGTTDCTNGASYNVKSTCVIMELYQ